MIHSTICLAYIALLPGRTCLDTESSMLLCFVIWLAFLHICQFSYVTFLFSWDVHIESFWTLQDCWTNPARDKIPQYWQIYEQHARSTCLFDPIWCWVEHQTWKLRSFAYIVHSVCLVLTCRCHFGASYKVAALWHVWPSAFRDIPRHICQQVWQWVAWRLEVLQNWRFSSSVGENS